jgi:hypothetical protein
MPDFSRAEIANETIDLTPYRTLLKRVAPGQTVTLPLEAGESPRRVMRAINAAARQSEVRLARVRSEAGAVRFRMLPPQKRAVTLSEEAKRSRGATARATREAHRREREQLEAMGMDPDAAGPAAAPPSSPGGPEPPATTQIEAPEQPGREAETRPTPGARATTRRRRSAQS